MVKARMIGAGIGIGMAFGAGLGLLLDNLVLGIACGLAIGAGAGVSLPVSNAKRKPQVKKAARDGGSTSDPQFYGAGPAGEGTSTKVGATKGMAGKDADGAGDGDGGGGGD